MQREVISTRLRISELREKEVAQRRLEGEECLKRCHRAPFSEGRKGNVFVGCGLLKNSYGITWNSS